MAAQGLLKQIHRGDLLPDPGASGTITVDRSPCFCSLVSATAETRTLARPTREGALVTLSMKTDGGDITLTVTGGYNETGDTTFTFSDPGQFAMFVACYDGTDYYWRLVSHYGLGNASPTEAGALDGLLATVTEINRAADMSTRVVDCTAATLTVTEAEHDGKTITLNRAAGIAVTLPVPVAGMKFRFVVQTTFTGAASIKSVAGTHIMIGHALMGNDSDNTTVLWQSLAASTNDTIDLFGTANSTGGIAGQVITIEAISSTVWFVEIIGDAAGTEATPFANTVA